MSGYNKKPRKSKVPNLQDPNKWKPQQDPQSFLTSKSGAGSKLSLDFLSGLGGVDMRPDNKGGSSGTGSTVVPAGNGLHNPFDKGSSYFDMLQGSYDTNGLITLLQSLGNNYGKGLTNDQASSWNKQLLDMILQQYANQEQRAYNESVLKEQRTYDAPTNQLARLMGAGISRDAAIQMLSGSGSGSGDGSALIGGAAEAIQPTLDPSEIKLNDIQGKTAIANTVFNGISAVGGLVSLGLSVPQSISQIRMLQNQRYMTDNQRNAYDAAVGAYSIINAAGVPNAPEVFGSINNTINTLAGLAEAGNEAAQMFLANGGAASLRATAPYSSPMLAQMYKTEREAADYNTQFSLYRRSEEAKNNLLQVDIRKAASECAHLEAATQELVTRSDFNVKQASLCESTAKYYDELAKSEPARRKTYLAQAKQLREQAKYYTSLAEQTEAITVGIERQNSLNAEFDASRTAEGITGRQWWINEKLQEVRSRCLDIAEASTKEQRDARMAALLADNESREAAAVLSTMYSNGTIDLLANDKNVEFNNVLLVCAALKDCGVSDYIHTLVEADTAGFETDAFNFGLNGSDGLGFGVYHGHSTGSDLGRDFISKLGFGNDNNKNNITPVYLRDPRKNRKRK